MKKKISIATINTWKCDGDYFKRIPLIIEELVDLNPDIILLQESFRALDLSICTGSMIENEIDKKLYYLSSRRKQRYLLNKKYDSFSGLAILTNLSIDKTGGKSLTSSEKDGGRNFQYLVISEPYNLLMINVHLTFLKDRELKYQQLEEVITFVREKNLPVIIGGDFNFTPDSEYYQYLQTELGNVLVDPMCSNNQTDLVTLPKSQTCIDYLFGVQNGKQLAFHHSQVCLNKFDTDFNCYPSDHFGLYTELYIQ